MGIPPPAHPLHMVWTSVPQPRLTRADGDGSDKEEEDEEEEHTLPARCCRIDNGPKSRMLVGPTSFPRSSWFWWKRPGDANCEKLGCTPPEPCCVIGRGFRMAPFKPNLRPTGLKRKQPKCLYPSLAEGPSLIKANSNSLTERKFIREMTAFGSTVWDGRGVVGVGAVRAGVSHSWVQCSGLSVPECWVEEKVHHQLGTARQRSG